MIILIIFVPQVKRRSLSSSNYAVNNEEDTVQPSPVVLEDPTTSSKTPSGSKDSSSGGKRSHSFHGGRSGDKKLAKVQGSLKAVLRRESHQDETMDPVPRIRNRNNLNSSAKRQSIDIASFRTTTSSSAKGRAGLAPDGK